MKGVFWNCNGFADPKKHRSVSDMVREKDLHFVALLEIGKRDCSQFFLKNLVGGKDFLWHCKPPHGRSGGMLSLPENRDFVTGTIFRESEKCTLMKIIFFMRVM